MHVFDLWLRMQKLLADADEAADFLRQSIVQVQKKDDGRHGIHRELHSA